MHKLTTNFLQYPNTTQAHPGRFVALTPQQRAARTVWKAPAQRNRVHAGKQNGLGSFPLGNNTLFASGPTEEPQKRLKPYTLLCYAKELSDPGDRITICQCVRPDVDVPGTVEIRQDAKGGKVNFGGLFQCGNVWQCAVCAGRTARKRGELVKLAMERHRTLRRGFCYLVTYTLQHREYSNLQFILSALRNASRRFKSGRWYQEMKKNIPGTIGGLETTWGIEFGWHPHLHEILFVDRKLNFYEKAEWRARWRRMVEKEGLFAGLQSCDIRETAPSDYIAKSGLELPKGDFEITGDMNKTRGGFTPWQLLEMSKGTRSTPTQRRAAELWREFITEFKGRHRLTWSRGLKQLFDVTEEDTAVANSITVGRITIHEYSILEKNNWQHDFLEEIERSGLENAKLLFFEETNYSPPWKLFKLAT